MKNHVGLAFMVIVSIVAGAEHPTVITPLGIIEGHWQISRMLPQPVVPWKGIFPAKFVPAVCQYELVQYEQGTGTEDPTMKGSEDCLYLQVYAPVDKLNVQNNTQLLPVIIFIYGSPFGMDSSINFKLNNLTDRDVIFVSMNYRVGPFGFLSTEDGVVTGNMGLKDQNLAMKWVTHNIPSFGGDPNQVTLAGLSAGGSSVHFHYLSPMSRGLYHGGISGSGTALNPWAQREASLFKAKKHRCLMGCPTVNNKEMIECLKSRPGRGIAPICAFFHGLS